MMSQKYPNHIIISDIGSGINFKRPGLRKIINYAILGRLEELVVAHKDRLCRIGYDLIEYILLTYSHTKIITDIQSIESDSERITKDLLEIITVYGAKLNGKRKYKKV
jgi:putative resolvase